MKKEMIFKNVHILERKSKPFASDDSDEMIPWFWYKAETENGMGMEIGSKREYDVDETLETINLIGREGKGGKVWYKEI